MFEGETARGSVVSSRVYKGGGNRKLTASEGKGIMRILQSLTGRSSEFYHDATKILVSPPPPLTLPLCP